MLQEPGQKPVCRIMGEIAPELSLVTHQIPRGFIDALGKDHPVLGNRHHRCRTHLLISTRRPPRLSSFLPSPGEHHLEPASGPSSLSNASLYSGERCRLTRNAISSNNRADSAEPDFPLRTAQSSSIPFSAVASLMSWYRESAASAAANPFRISAEGFLPISRR